MINCQEARNAITILEVECPQCGDSVEVFVKDGVVCTDSVCTECGTRYVPSPKSGVIITLNCCLWFWVSFYLSNSWHSPVATIVLFLLAFLQYAFVGILLRRFGTWRPISGNKPLEQQEYLLPTIVWSMLTALGLSLLMFAVTALMQ